MSWRDFPLIPSVIVALAVAIMVALGFWQLGRAEEKTALLTAYAAIPEDAEPVAYPADEDAIEANLYRRTSAECIEPISTRSIAGTNRVGAKGWAHIVRCKIGPNKDADMAIGWSHHPSAPQWDGGEITGILGPGGKIVADPPEADLGPLAKPDPRDLPNNHTGYAVQWFLFALTALVIYVLAVRRRVQKS